MASSKMHDLYEVMVSIAADKETEEQSLKQLQMQPARKSSQMPDLDVEIRPQDYHRVWLKRIEARRSFMAKLEEKLGCKDCSGNRGALGCRYHRLAHRKTMKLCKQRRDIHGEKGRETDR